MFLGLRSVIHPAPDLQAATAYFTTMLGTPPYFETASYVGFDVGGYELGLLPDGDPAVGPVTYWGVDDVDAALAHVVGCGAVALGPVADVGDSIRLVELTAPTGQVFGLIEHPNFVARS